MYRLVNDTDYKRLIIRNDNGDTLAAHGYPNKDLPVLHGKNLHLYRRLRRLVKFANLGVSQLDEAKRQISKLESLVESFEIVT